MEIKFDSKELSVFTRTEIAKEISSAEALMALAKDDEIIVRRAVFYLLRQREQQPCRAGPCHGTQKLGQQNCGFRF